MYITDSLIRASKNLFSGSLVIDCLTSNGDPDPPKIQRVFWAVMEGATASALLAAGGKGGLQALQTAGVVSGLPYTFVICILCVALWRAVKVAAGDLDPFGPTFAIGKINIKLWSIECFRIRSCNTYTLWLQYINSLYICLHKLRII